MRIFKRPKFAGLQFQTFGGRGCRQTLINWNDYRAGSVAHKRMSVQSTSDVNRNGECSVMDLPDGGVSDSRGRMTALGRWRGGRRRETAGVLSGGRLAQETVWGKTGEGGLAVGVCWVNSHTCGEQWTACWILADSIWLPHMLG